MDAKDALRGFKNLKISKDSASKGKESEGIYEIQTEEEIVTCQICDKKGHSSQLFSALSEKYGSNKSSSFADYTTKTSRKIGEKF